MRKGPGTRADWSEWASRAQRLGQVVAVERLRVTPRLQQPRLRPGSVRGGLKCCNGYGTVADHAEVSPDSKPSANSGSVQR